MRNYISNVSIRKLKDAIISVFPSIIFGGQFTNVDKISMASSTSGDVQQTLLIRTQTENDDVLVSGQNAPVAEDVFVIPTSATITCAGFPLFSYGQKFYIDMGTNTTADNFYYVVGIRHTLGPGQFKTSLDVAFGASATIRSTRNMLKTLVPPE